MKLFNPLYNAFLVWLQNHDVKGKYWFFQKTQEYFNGRLIAHRYNGNIFHVPYEQWCFWKTLGPHNYYLEEVVPFTDVINTELKSFDFFDLGADVGVMSLLVNLHCPRLENSYAFEPNPRSFNVLKKNSQSSDKPVTAVNQAVSNFAGEVHLQFDSNCHSDHEGFIDINKTGHCQVTSLDQYIKNIGHETSPFVALKIDVEGQEQQVIEGATELLSTCEKAVIFLEIHPDTLKRSEQTPEDLFSAIPKTRKVKWSVPLLNKNYDSSRKFFDQFPEQQYDVIGVIE